MIRQIKDTVHAAVDSVTAGQLLAGTSAGLVAQLASMWDVTLQSVIQLPFLVLTLFSFLNWLTGGIKAVVEGRFSAIKLCHGPFRWLSYIVIGIIISNGGLLLSELFGLGINLAFGAITTVYVIALAREADSVLENIDAPPFAKMAWSAIVSRFPKQEEEKREEAGS